ncbi:hypothetical protein DFS33DRAFT_1386465 [Desarmillaria ectypa]|nr:hypothetical protein DFS33DRAFT_1386465 [Desarmillaria ectypa]
MSFRTFEFLKNHIFPLLSPLDLVCVGQTDEAKNAAAGSKQIPPSPSRLWRLISGSSGVQFFEYIRYPDSELDVYVEHKYFHAIGQFLLTAGYTFNLHDKQEEGFSDVVSHVSEDVGVRDENTSLTGYHCRGIADVYDFSRNAIQVQLITSKKSAMKVILNHATCREQYDTGSADRNLGTAVGLEKIGKHQRPSLSIVHVNQTQCRNTSASCNDTEERTDTNDYGRSPYDATDLDRDSRTASSDGRPLSIQHGSSVLHDDQQGRDVTSDPKSPRVNVDRNSSLSFDDWPSPGKEQSSGDDNRRGHDTTSDTTEQDSGSRRGDSSTPSRTPISGAGQPPDTIGYGGGRDDTQTFVNNRTSSHGPVYGSGGSDYGGYGASIGYHPGSKLGLKDKLRGNAEVLVGRATKKPELVERGLERKAGNAISICGDTILPFPVILGIDGLGDKDTRSLQRSTLLYSLLVSAIFFSVYALADLEDAQIALDLGSGNSIKSGYAAAGIKLLVSVSCTTDVPTTSGADPIATATTMAAWVIEYGLDGIDFDYEDFAAMNGGGTAELCGGSYTKINQKVGDLIDWYNIHFYNQGSTEYAHCDGLLAASSSTWPETALFEIANNGIDLSKLVTGKPVASNDATNGYMNTSMLATCL